MKNLIWYILVMTLGTKIWTKKVASDNAELRLLLDQGRQGDGYVAIPERGILLERTGTLISHTGYDAASFVLQLAPFDRGLTTEGVSVKDFVCDKYRPAENDFTSWTPYEEAKHYYDNQLNLLREAFTAVYTSELQLKSAQLCTTFNITDDRCSQLPLRRRRFVLGGVAVALAGSALGLSLQNKEQLREIETMLDDQEEGIQTLKTALRQKVTNDDEIHDALIEQTNNLYGFVRELQDIQANHQNTLSCLAIFLQLQTNAQLLLDQIKATMQYVNQGQLSGKLTPTLMTNSELTKFVRFLKGSNRRFYTDFPHMLYQTATATLVEANFDKLQFRYVLLFPNMDTATLAPFFAIRQVGFEAQHQYDNSTTCLSFEAPPYAVYQKGQWFVLNTPRECPTFGRAMTCHELQYQLYNFHECLNSTGPVSHICKPRKCTRESYISSPMGLLLRTKEKNVQIASQKSAARGELHPHRQTTSEVSAIDMPAYQVAFIQWTVNVTSVSFGNTIVHAPDHIEPDGILYRKPPMGLPFLTLLEALAIPEIGTDKLVEIVEAFQTQMQRLQQEHGEVASSQPIIRGTIEGIKAIPRYLMIAAWIAAILVFLFLVKMIKDIIAPNAKCSDCLPQCSRDSEPSRSWSRADAIPAGPERLTRSTSHISLVVNSGDKLPTAPPIQTPEEKYRLETLPRNFTAPYLQGYRSLYPDVSTAAAPATMLPTLNESSI